MSSSAVPQIAAAAPVKQEPKGRGGEEETSSTAAAADTSAVDKPSTTAGDQAPAASGATAGEAGAQPGTAQLPAPTANNRCQRRARRDDDPAREWSVDAPPLTLARPRVPVFHTACPFTHKQVCKCPYFFSARYPNMVRFFSFSFCLFVSLLCVLVVAAVLWLLSMWNHIVTQRCPCTAVLMWSFGRLQSTQAWERRAETISTRFDLRKKKAALIARFRHRHSVSDPSRVASLALDAGLELARERALSQRLYRDGDAGQAPDQFYAPADVHNYRQFARQYHVGVPALRDELSAAQATLNRVHKVSRVQFVQASFGLWCVWFSFWWLSPCHCLALAVAAAQMEREAETKTRTKLQKKIVKRHKKRAADIAPLQPSILKKARYVLDEDGLHA